MALRSVGSAILLARVWATAFANVLIPCGRNVACRFSVLYCAAQV